MPALWPRHPFKWVGPFVIIASALGLFAGSASAFPPTLGDWQSRYGAISPSADNANCQLCHGNPNGGSPWNAYGWDVRDAIANLDCDLDGDNTVSNDEAFYCVENDNSDNDGSGYTNLDEIGVGTQPGWTGGPNNTLYTRVGSTEGQLPPEGIGPVDPDGTEPPPPTLPPPPGELPEIPQDQIGPDLILVKPGQSIQAAIDIAEPGMTIYVQSGSYSELLDQTNGLVITKSGLRLVGETGEGKRVILENAGNQRNGIVVVPSEVENCMGCHSDLAFPFPLHDWVPPGLPEGDPEVFGVEIRGITIQNFRNNGLFTERVDGFRFIDVESIDNPGYGIFPTLSSNGLIAGSRASGSDDSGIWIETSVNVAAVYNLVEDNVNGFEISNSEDILIANNIARGNTVGVANLLLPDIFDDRPGSKRVDIRNNLLVANNKPNTARPGSVLSFVPSGIGILHLGVDDSVISNNWIQGNDFSAITVADYCLTVLGTDFACSLDQTVTPEFLADQGASNNVIRDNVVIDNGNNPQPGHPFEAFAADMILLTTGDRGNCYEGNGPAGFSVTSLLGVLPPCP